MRVDTATIQRRTNPLVALWHHALVQAFLNDPITVISGTFVVVVVVSAIFAPWVAPHGDRDQQVPLRHLPPMSTGLATEDITLVKEERFYLLGTDHLGRDMVSRLIYGGRISLAVGL